MPRGGKRNGAGRPKGTGKFGEPTKAVRLPISQIGLVMQIVERKNGICPFCQLYSPVEENETENCALKRNQKEAD